MPHFNHISVATVRDLANFYTKLADECGDHVVPYFYNDLNDKEFVVLEPLAHTLSVLTTMGDELAFVALSTFNPDPDCESGLTLLQQMKQS